MRKPLVVGGLGLLALALLLRRRDGEPEEGFPLDGCNDGACVTSLYGRRTSPISGASTCHRGVDLGRPTGTPVRSILDGVVSFSGTTQVGGETVYIDHGDGIISHYMHLSRRRVNVGLPVDANELIGDVGSTGLSTGPHLHFGLKVDGVYIDPGPFIGLPEGRPC